VRPPQVKNGYKNRVMYKSHQKIKQPPLADRKIKKADRNTNHPYRVKPTQKEKSKQQAGTEFFCSMMVFFFVENCVSMN